MLSVLLALVLLLSLLATARTALVAYGPAADEDDLVAQIRFLDRAIAEGEDRRMQQFFPEGRFFTVVLTALAESSTPQADLRVLRERLAVLDSADLTAPFGTGLTPEHGVFHAGWTLLLATEIARRSSDPDDLAAVRERADGVAAALTSEPSGFPTSYPGQRWPCDAVVAAAALARADALSPTPAWSQALARWRYAVLAALDPATRLLPHQVDARGRALDGPRGSSQAIIQTFWPDVALRLDGNPDPATWQRFVRAFVDRRAGLVGVREYPRDVTGASDVDSGPLVLGISASASAVALAAARRAGDIDLAEALDREAELLGLGLTWGGQRRYAAGVLPVGDAFLAWARSQPTGVPHPSEAPAPWWSALVGLSLAPGLLAAAGLAALVRGGSRIPRARAAQP